MIEVTETEFRLGFGSGPDFPCDWKYAQLLTSVDYVIRLQYLGGSDRFDTSFLGILVAMSLAWWVLNSNSDADLKNTTGTDLRQMRERTREPKLCLRGARLSPPIP